MNNRNDQQDPKGKDRENDTPTRSGGPELVDRKVPRVDDDGDHFNKAVNEQLDEDAAAEQSRKETSGGEHQGSRNEQPALEEDEDNPAKPDNS